MRPVAVLGLLLVLAIAAGCGSSEPDAAPPEQAAVPEGPTAPSPSDFARRDDRPEPAGDAAATEGSGAEQVDGEATPAPVAPTEEAPPAEADPRPPDLALLVLGLGDLPEGVTVRQEGFVSGDPTIVAYRRTFDPLGAPEQLLPFVELENDVLLFQTIEDASAALVSVRDELTAEPADVFRRMLSGGAAFDPGDIRGETHVFPMLDDATVTALASFDTPAGRAEGLLVFSQVGRFQNVFFFVAPAGTLEIEEAGMLVETVSGRLRAEVLRLGEELASPEQPSGGPPPPEPASPVEPDAQPEPPPDSSGEPEA